MPDLSTLTWTSFRGLGHYCLNMSAPFSLMMILAASSVTSAVNCAHCRLRSGVPSSSFLVKALQHVAL